MAELDTTNPSGLRAERTIEAGGRKVVVRELTVGEVRAWLKDANAELDRNDLVALALIERGHAGVWNYLWRLFMQARVMKRPR